MTTNTYHIMNADLMEHCGVRPSTLTRGDVISVPTQLTACPWIPGNKTIPVGKYVVVNRKHFRGGSQEIAPA